MSSTIRVLHVLNRLAGGGAERLVLDLVTHASPGTLASVATVMPGGEMAAEFAGAGVDVRCANRGRFHPGYRAYRRLRRWCREVDVVHTHLWGGDFFGGLAARSGGRHVISTVHNTKGDGHVRDWLLGRCETADLVVGVSPEAVEFAREGGVPEKHLRCVPNGVDLSRFPASPWEAGPPWRLLFVGRLTEQKGLDLLIRALEGLAGVTLHVVGDGEDRVAMEELATSLNVDVVFRGWSSNIAREYADSHLVVLPSRWEGFGLVAVEAMSTGRPVLGTAVGGLATVLGEVGIVVASESVEALGDAIRASLANVADLKSRAASGPASSLNWSIRTTVESYERLYRDLAISDKEP